MPTTRTDTRDALLEAAESLFAERGFEGAGIREIADRAGANIAAISYHFGSKSDLYVHTIRRAVGRTGCESVWAHLDPPPEGEPAAAAALARFIRGFLHMQHAGGDSTVFTLIMREAAEPSGALDSIVEDFIRPRQLILRRGLRALCPRAEESEIVLSAEGVMARLLHTRVFRPFIERSGVADLSNPAHVDRLARHIVISCLRGLGCAEPLIRRSIEVFDLPLAPPPPSASE